MRAAPGSMQNNPARRVIGITGGVGAGKSRIVQILEREYRAEAIRADDTAHRLMEPGAEGFARLLEAFGDSLLGKDGMVDKEKMSGLIFGNPEMRKRVDGLIHPLVWREIRERIARSEASVIAVESAVADQEYGDICDEIWYVDTSRENRIRRLAEGRGYTREKCLKIMDSQPDEAGYRALGGRVIDNNGSLKSVRRQIEAFLGSGDGGAEIKDKDVTGI